MKAWKTVIFIFATLIGLALICLFFPKDGIKTGDANLEFPTLTAALTPAPQHETKPDKPASKAVDEKIEALHNAKQKEFDDFCHNSSTRIYMPANNEAYLDPLFEALDNARNKPVRIMHYGDSQLECDRMTSAIREHFQTSFGGGGQGMVPAVQPIATFTLGQTVSPALKRFCAFGSSDFRAGHHRYGPMAAMSRVDGSATFTFTSRGEKKFPHCQKFQKISVVIKGKANMTLKTSDSVYTLTPNIANDSTLRIYTTTTARPTNKVTLNVNGNMDIYGILLDGKNGVAMDNIPMRGCSGTIFTTIDRSSMAPFFKQQNVGLIILQYGGNSVPYLNGEKNISHYKEQIKSQIRLFRQMAPNSRILFIGPADMSTRRGGVLQTYPCLEQVISALREAANEEGAAFWDMYSAMGGHNSMVEWVNARPQLAGGDYIHFTPLGAEKMSQMLYDTLLLYYKFYRFRTGKDPIDKIDTNKSTHNDTATQKSSAQQ